MTSAIHFDLDANVAMLGGQSMVFHCHHYNCALQRAIEDSMGARAAEVLCASATEAAGIQLRAIDLGGDSNARMRAAAQLFCELGFGRLELGELDARGGRVHCPASHYAMGWLSKYGERATPVCHFVRGYLAASVATAYGLDPTRVHVRETGCVATGAGGCAFEVEVM